MKRLFVGLLVLSIFSGCNSEEKGQSTEGGTFFVNINSIPTTLNPITSTDGYSTRVHAYVYEGLLSRNLDTYEWEEGLASEWEISEDGLKYTFTLRDGVKWHDGKPLTIEDVKFSFDVIRDDKYNTAHLRPYIENISEAKILSKNQIQFIAKKKYFGNFDSVAGGIVTIIPKHFYGNLENEKDKKKWNQEVIGTGPYILNKFDRKKGITLEKNPNWWGNTVASKKGVHNFERVFLRYISDKNIALEYVKKGRLDFEGIDPEIYQKKTSGEGWGKEYFKIKTKNKAPKGYTFLGWNLNKPLFKSKKVRKALYHLFNRDLMNEKFRYGMDLLATGPLYQQSMFADQSIKPIKFDPKLALELLKEEGWKDTDGDQILDKMINGKKVKFSFTILEPWQEFMKYLTVFKEDAKKAGIEVNLKYVEWNAFMKLLDERKFDAMRLAWGAGGVNWDPKQIWHSSSAKSGSNFIGYNNPRVDKLIDESREILDAEKRAEKLKEIYRLIVEDYPYVFFFNSQYTMYVHTNKVDKEKETYNYSVGTTHWWLQKN